INVQVGSTPTHLSLPLSSLSVSTVPCPSLPLSVLSALMKVCILVCDIWGSDESIVDAFPDMIDIIIKKTLCIQTLVEKRMLEWEDVVSSSRMKDPSTNYSLSSTFGAISSSFKQFMDILEASKANSFEKRKPLSLLPTLVPSTVQVDPVWSADYKPGAVNAPSLELAQKRIQKRKDARATKRELQAMRAEGEMYRQSQVKRKEKERMKRQGVQREVQSFMESQRAAVNRADKMSKKEKMKRKEDKIKGKKRSVKNKSF
ncbi:hypothetical protein ADUPG1_008400, partial [Aduncisulcus paluster]